MTNKLNEIIEEYKNFFQVIGIALGGSSSAKTSDSLSDIDLYVFTENDIPVFQREGIIKKYSSKYEIGEEYFGSGDEFFADDLNCQLDVMYWSKSWFENIVDNVWFKNYASNGYTTCFLYTLKNFNILYDRENWLKNLQVKINTKYPEKLKNNIIKRNMMLMKDKPFASYYEQTEKAVKRGDKNSINHRISAFMASYFDVIFAKNELLHPGEKRLVCYAKNYCKILPKNFEENINKLFLASDSDKLDILSEMFTNLKDITLY